MKLSLNQVTLAGNLGADAEIAFMTNGDAKAQFNVATTRSWQVDGQWQEATDWHRVVLWRPSDYVQTHLQKGTPVIVEGRLQTRQYEKDGATRYVTEVIARKVQPLVQNDKQPQEAKTQGEQLTSDPRGYQPPPENPRRLAVPQDGGWSGSTKEVFPLSQETGITDDDVPF